MQIEGTSKSMRIYIKNSNGFILSEVTGNNALTLHHPHTYSLGDVIVFETETPHVSISLDPLLTAAPLYIPKGRFEYAIPFDEKKKAYPPQSFMGNYHEIRMEKTSLDALRSRHNLALNPLDKRDISTAYPHSDANVMTRDESVFESRNAIDGFKDNQGHGVFPYQSWGGGLRDDLCYELYFGQEVTIDEIAITLRADYVNDHDIHWESGVIAFSDGSELPIEMIKTTETQHFTFNSKTITWLKLYQLKREVSSAYSALTQIEVYGVVNI